MNNPNTIAKQMGAVLINAGVKMMASGIDLSPEEIDTRDIMTFLRSRTGVSESNIVLSDLKYKVISWEKAKEVLDAVIPIIKKWMPEFYDCDNQAFFISVIASYIFGINSFGATHGYVYNKDKGTLIGGHFWNVIIAKNEKGELDLYVFESGNSLSAKLASPMILGNWKYEALSYRYF